MTAYTITEAQRKVLIDMSKFAYNACHSDFVMDEKIMPAMALLEALQPNTQEPVGYAYENQDFVGSVIGAKGEWAPNEIALYAHPALQAKPLTDAFAKAASERGLTLVITVDGYKLMKYGPATAHGGKT